MTLIVYRDLKLITKFLNTSLGISSIWIRNLPAHLNATKFNSVPSIDGDDDYDHACDKLWLCNLMSHVMMKSI